MVEMYWLFGLTLVYIMILPRFPRIDQGAICQPVSYSPDEGSAFIDVKLSKITTSIEANNPSLKVPVLVFKYTDLDKFANIPTVDEYKQLHRQDMVNGLIDPQTSSSFLLQPNDDGGVESFNPVYNGILKFNQTSGAYKVHVPIESSGYYCVYSNQPTDSLRISLNVGFRSSLYWYLTLAEYKGGDHAMSALVLLTIMVMFLHFLQSNRLALQLASNEKEPVSFDKFNILVMSFICVIFLLWQHGRFLTASMNLAFYNNAGAIRGINERASMLFEVWKATSLYCLLLILTRHGAPIKLDHRTMLCINFALILVCYSLDHEVLAKVPFSKYYLKRFSMLDFLDYLHPMITMVVDLFPIIWIWLISCNSNIVRKRFQYLKKTMSILLGTYLVLSFILGIVLLHRGLSVSRDSFYALIRCYIGISSREDVIKAEIFKTQFLECIQVNFVNELCVAWIPTATIYFVGMYSMAIFLKEKDIDYFFSSKRIIPVFDDYINESKSILGLDEEEEGQEIIEAKE